MDATGFSGFAADLPRVFSVPTLALGVILFTYGIGAPIVGGQYPPPDEALAMGAGLGLLGLHGVFTNVRKVGIIRKFISYCGGAAGGVISFWAAQTFGLI